MNIVLDTNILISSTLWDNSVAQRLLFKLINQDTFIYSSIEILKEYQNVLNRDFGYSNEEIMKIIERMLLFIKLVTPKERIQLVKDDAEDNKVIECAIESSSSYIITYDKHLLSIKEYEGIKIIRPEEAMSII